MANILEAVWIMLLKDASTDAFLKLYKNKNNMMLSYNSIVIDSIWHLLSSKKKRILCMWQHNIKNITQSIRVLHWDVDGYQVLFQLGLCTSKSHILWMLVDKVAL